MDGIILPISVINDLRFWLKWIDNIKIVSMYTILNNPSINVFAATDACEEGAGYVIDSLFAKYKFNKNDLNLSINQKEAHCVLTLIESHKHFLTGKALKLYIDNTSCYYSMVRKWSTSYNMMIFVFELCLLMIKYKIYVHFVWLPSAFNFLPDRLSRFKMIEFHELCNTFNLKLAETKPDYFGRYQFANNPLMNYENDMLEYANFIKWLKQPLSIRAISPYKCYMKV